MKGIILAGDAGRNLEPLTLGVPKQLLPIYNKPMVYYPLYTLVQSGIRDILLISSKEHQDAFRRSLGDGAEFGTSLSYACQERPEGVAQAIMIAQDFIGNDSLCLVTGDTVIMGDSIINKLIKAYKAADKSGNATIFVDKDYDPNQYGMVVLGYNRKVYDIVGISNKPNYYSITGLYVFPNSVLEHVFNIEKSERERYEITTVSKLFLNRNKLQIQKLSSDCKWLDTSNFNNLLASSQYVQNHSIED